MDFIGDHVVPLVTRLALGLFLAGFAMGVSYLGAWVIVVSFFELTPRTVDAMAIGGIGIGAGVGGSLPWIDLDGPPFQMTLMVAVGVTGALIGAWIGQRFGEGAAVGILGMPGIAELSGVLQGAIAAANVAPMLLFFTRAVRRRVWPPEPLSAPSLPRRTPPRHPNA